MARNSKIDEDIFLLPVDFLMVPAFQYSIF